MSCALTPAEVARSGIQTAFFARLGPPESVPGGKSTIGAWNSSRGRYSALFWCSNRPAVLPGERHMGNVGLEDLPSTRAAEATGKSRLGQRI